MRPETKRNAAIVALAAAALTYGYNVKRNLAGGEQMHAACTSIRRSIDERMKPASLSMLVDDPAALAKDLRAEIDAPCVTIGPRLAWWQWNFGAHVAVPPDPARAARLEAARVAMIPRCVPVVRRMLDASNLTGASPESLDASARDSCDQIAGSLSSPTSEPGPPIAVWDWPDRLSALARSLAAEAAPEH
ncbi:MAG: hypothetical protein ABJE95_37015 [Byssovorax sp.]